MKHFFSGMAIALALVLVLVMGVVALAENPGNDGPELPAADDLQQTPEAQENEAEAPETQQPEAQQDDAALQEALDAYRQARQSAREEDLQTELDGYVESGKLTQEQADLIMNYYKERESQRNGTCPNCGYQFQNGQGKGGRMNGGNFGQGRGGFGQNGNDSFGQGGNGGFGQGKGGRRGFGQQAMPGNSDTLPAQPGLQGAPQAESFNSGI